MTREFDSLTVEPLTDRVSSGLDRVMLMDYSTQFNISVFGEVAPIASLGREDDLAERSWTERHEIEATRVERIIVITKIAMESGASRSRSVFKSEDARRYHWGVCRKRQPRST